MAENSPFHGEENFGLIGREFDIIEKRFCAIENGIVAIKSEMQTHNALGTVIDHKIATLQGDVKVIAVVTTEVRDILTTFKTLGTFAKWSAGLGAAVLGLIVAVKGYLK